MNWLKRLVAGKEMDELERWRAHWSAYRQWLAEFDTVGETLDNLYHEATGDQPPGAPEYPYSIVVLRERLRLVTREREGWK
jgi:hypothetical protein